VRSRASTPVFGRILETSRFFGVIVASESIWRRQRASPTIVSAVSFSDWNRRVCLFRAWFAADPVAPEVGAPEGHRHHLAAPDRRPAIPLIAELEAGTHAATALKVRVQIYTHVVAELLNLLDILGTSADAIAMDANGIVLAIAQRQADLVEAQSRGASASALATSDSISLLGPTIQVGDASNATTPPHCSISAAVSGTLVKSSANRSSAAVSSVPI
jgi:hypothetical protein